MTTAIKSKTDQMNAIYDEFYEYFTGDFHGFLYKIIIEGYFRHKKVALTPMVDGTIGLATLDERGYIPMVFYFRANIRDRNERESIITKLNQAIWDLEPKDAYMIVLSSMRK